MRVPSLSLLSGPSGLPKRPPYGIKGSWMLDEMVARTGASAS
jgi:hypothetical protein